jgi:hypothetical protein
MLFEPILDNFSPMTWGIVLLKYPIVVRVNDVYEGVQMVIE